MKKLKIMLTGGKGRERGALIPWLISTLAVCYAVSGLGYFAFWRSSPPSPALAAIAARHYAQSGVAMACNDFNAALANPNASVAASLLNNPGGAYKLNPALSGSAAQVFERTIPAACNDHGVEVQIWVARAGTPPAARIVGVARVGRLTQRSAVNVMTGVGQGAAIISINPGTSDTDVAKAMAQNEGNVVVKGGDGGPLIVTGNNEGLAIVANGRVNISDSAIVSPQAVAMTNWATTAEIPDYASPGASNALFDFKQFIALADRTPNGPSPWHNNHFSNLASFIAACKSAAAASNGALEGMIVVDVADNDPEAGSLDAEHLPQGINIRGTLFVNFIGKAGHSSDGKIITSCALNINAANLGAIIATDPATYTSGYPAAYHDPSKNPVHVNVAPASDNITAEQALPALVYSAGIVDIHGPCNICGVCLTPGYLEIAQKGAHQTQYIRGAIITGSGIYIENTAANCSTMVSYDPSALDNLSTFAKTGKEVQIAYGQ